MNKVFLLLVCAGFTLCSVSSSAETFKSSNSASSQLVGITWKSKSRNGQLEIAPGYFHCGSSSVDSNKGLGLYTVHKGRTTKCNSASEILLLAVSLENGKTLKILDVVDVNVSKGYSLVISDCKGANAAVVKVDDEMVWTKISTAWKVKDEKLQPVQNLKSVSCENSGWGV